MFFGSFLSTAGHRRKISTSSTATSWIVADTLWRSCCCFSPSSEIARSLCIFSGAITRTQTAPSTTASRRSWSRNSRSTSPRFGTFAQLPFSPCCLLRQRLGWKGDLLPGLHTIEGYRISKR
ncbi:unnamed protein product [Effrenium voratum]|uniref:Uncharacterized protein n=1 Tax=Effrenium voratum TaxID=2562239 RepID=A0AA36J6D8_9DINO|nr:unnamed protein product [Effrenium voratum]